MACSSCEAKRKKAREELLRKQKERAEQRGKIIESNKIVEPVVSKWGRWDMCPNCWNYNFYCVCKTKKWQVQLV